jgi:hypothetical protein
MSTPHAKMSPSNDDDGEADGDVEALRAEVTAMRQTVAELLRATESASAEAREYRQHATIQMTEMVAMLINVQRRVVDIEYTMRSDGASKGRSSRPVTPDD